MLQRTLSDESLCSGRREPSHAHTYGYEQALPSDVLFTSTYPSSTLPVRKQHPPPSNGSLSEKGEWSSVGGGGWTSRTQALWVRESGLAFPCRLQGVLLKGPELAAPVSRPGLGALP